jgi:hypothetical protein
MAILTFDVDYLLRHPWIAAMAVFQIWMLIDAVRRQEWIWAFFILVFSGFSALMYFFWVYRAAPSATQGFQLPGSDNRQRIRELEAQIHLLDKAHHHLQLGDIYFQKGNLEKAEACYRASLERDPQDIDARAHMGQCLLRQKKPELARPILQQVCSENPKHDYGYSLMAYAETLTALGEKESAITTWKQVLDSHSYARARVQLAELHLAQGEKNLAEGELRGALNDDLHAPGFQRKRDRVWISKAKKLLRQ